MPRRKKEEYIFTSPDGGHTVYQQRIGDSKRTLIEKDEVALATEQAQQEDHMSGVDAIQIRKKYPALQEAWNRYKTTWELCVGDDDHNQLS